MRLGYKVNEIFYSLQGEGFYTGTAAVFIRLSGCNLHCDFCDTKHEEGQFLQVKEILQEIDRVCAGARPSLVVLTGGEPTLTVDDALCKALAERFRGMKPMIDYLSRIGTKAFVIAALEELAVILLATCYVLVHGAYSLQVWAALFMAFSFHLLVHVLQAVLARGYVPGVVSALLLLPYSYIGLEGIWLAMSGWEMVACGVAGVVFMAANLLLAHRLAGWAVRVLGAARAQAAHQETSDQRKTTE